MYGEGHVGMLPMMAGWGGCSVATQFRLTFSPESKRCIKALGSLLFNGAVDGTASTAYVAAIRGGVKAIRYFRSGHRTLAAHEAAEAGSVAFGSAAVEVELNLLSLAKDGVMALVPGPGTWNAFKGARAAC